jgi:hypothetical protein
MCGNTIAYMLAYAIHVKADIVELFAAPHSSPTEYIEQRPSVYYWLGQCEGAGVKVIDHSNMLNRGLFYMRGK